MQLDETTRSTWDVRHYGAAGDGTSDDADAIQLAVDRCHAAGGGQVLLPAGRYRSGPIRLLSNVQLHLSAGARLLAGPTGSATEPLIFVLDQDNVSITGAGAIDGGDVSGPVIVADRSRRIRVHDVTLVHGPHGTLRLDRCRDVELRGLTVTNAAEVRTGDGIELVDSRDVNLSDCRIRAGAGALVVRTSDRAADDHGPSCENVIVGRCLLGAAERAIGLVGGGGVLRNCLFTDLMISDSGLGIDITAGASENGARIEGLRFSNLIIDTTTPIAVRADAGAAMVRDLTFTGLTITASSGASLIGAAETPLERIRLSDVDWTLSGAGETDDRSAALHGRHLAGLVVDGVTVRRDGVVNGNGRDDFVLEHTRGVLVRGLIEEPATSSTGRGAE